jgi:hypothetical protein
MIEIIALATHYSPPPVGGVSSKEKVESRSNQRSRPLTTHHPNRGGR